jgi:GLPGLI family protein
MFKVIVMKKIFYISILIFSFIFFENSWCQSFSGKIVYKVQFIGLGLEDDADQEDKDLNEAIVKIANQQTCTLSFNGKRSSSILNRYLISDTENNGLMNMARKMAFIVTNESDYFFDKISNTAIRRDDNGSLIEIKHKILDWEITKESKLIDGYLCYKAIYNDKFINRRGVKTSVPIIAWFAPSLPYGYGPKYFNGLPGLILELNDRETTFYATSISILKDKELVIEFPKGKTISQEDYTKKGQSN